MNDWAEKRAEQITNYVEFNPAFESRPFSYLCREMLRKEITAALLEARQIRLPDWLENHACLTGDCGCEIQQDCNAKVFSDVQDAIQSLNAPKGENNE